MPTVCIEIELAIPPPLPDPLSMSRVLRVVSPYAGGHPTDGHAVSWDVGHIVQGEDDEVLDLLLRDAPDSFEDIPSTAFVQWPVEPDDQAVRSS